MSILGWTAGYMVYPRGAVYVQERHLAHRGGSAWHVMRVNHRGHNGKGDESVIAVFASKRDAVAFAQTKQPKEQS